MSSEGDSSEERKPVIGYSEEVREKLSHFDPEMLLADGFDDCIVGTCYTPGPGFRAVYDVDRMIETLVERDGMSWEEAWEYFEFNTEGAYVGEKTPIFWRRFLED